MALQVTKKQIDTLQAHAQRVMARAKSITEKSEEAIGQVVQSTEITGAAFAAGVLKGRYSAVEVAGVPADLGAALGAHVLGFFGGGKYQEHIHNVADGVLASYMTTLGVGVGDRMRVEAARALPAAAASGAMGPGSDRVTDTEMQALKAAGLR